MPTGDSWFTFSYQARKQLVQDSSSSADIATLIDRTGFELIGRKMSSISGRGPCHGTRPEIQNLQRRPFPGITEGHNNIAYIQISVHDVQPVGRGQSGNQLPRNIECLLPCELAPIDDVCNLLPFKIFCDDTNVLPRMLQSVHVAEVLVPQSSGRRYIRLERLAHSRASQRRTGNHLQRKHSVRGIVADPIRYGVKALVESVQHKIVADSFSRQFEKVVIASIPKARNVGALGHLDHNRVFSSFGLEIFGKLAAQATDLRANNRVQARIEVRAAVVYVGADYPLL